MEWFIAVLAIVLLGVAAMAAAGGMGEMSKEPVRDVYRQQLPDRPLTAQDLQHVRFGVTVRGYAMSQVDDLLDRLGREIAERDRRIADLTSGPPSSALGTPEPANRPPSSPSASELNGAQSAVPAELHSHSSTETLPNGLNSHPPTHAAVRPDRQPYAEEETGQR
jgi:DivIVA domain-containing protein